VAGWGTPRERVEHGVPCVGSFRFLPPEFNFLSDSFPCTPPCPPAHFQMASRLQILAQEFEMVSFEWAPSLPSCHLVGAIGRVSLATRAFLSERWAMLCQKTLLSEDRASSLSLRKTLLVARWFQNTSLDSISTYIWTGWKGRSRLYLVQKENKPSCATFPGLLDWLPYWNSDNNRSFISRIVSLHSNGGLQCSIMLSLMCVSCFVSSNLGIWTIELARVDNELW